MKHTRQFNEFVNERVTKYKTYISSKFIKNSNLDLNDALDALFSLNYDEHEVMNSIRRTLKKQRPDIADSFEDDLIDLEGALSGAFDVIQHIKNKIDDLE
jgi:hypothetical protein